MKKSVSACEGVVKYTHIAIFLIAMCFVYGFYSIGNSAYQALISDATLKAFYKGYDEGERSGKAQYSGCVFAKDNYLKETDPRMNDGFCRKSFYEKH